MDTISDAMKILEDVKIIHSQIAGYLEIVIDELSHTSDPKVMEILKDLRDVVNKLRKL